MRSWCVGTYKGSTFADAQPRDTWVQHWCIIDGNVHISGCIWPIPFIQSISSSAIAPQWCLQQVSAHESLTYRRDSMIYSTLPRFRLIWTKVCSSARKPSIYTIQSAEYRSMWSFWCMCKVLWLILYVMHTFRVIIHPNQRISAQPLVMSVIGM